MGEDREYKKRSVETESIRREVWRDRKFGMKSVERCVRVCEEQGEEVAWRMEGGESGRREGWRV